MTSDAPVVFVIVAAVPDCGIICTTLARVVISLATQDQVDDEVNAGLNPVRAAEFEARVATPITTCAVAPVAVFPQATAPVVAPHEYTVGTPPALAGMLRVIFPACAKAMVVAVAVVAPDKLRINCLVGSVPFVIETAVVPFGVIASPMFVSEPPTPSVGATPVAEFVNLR